MSESMAEEKDPHELSRCLSSVHISIEGFAYV